MGDKQEWLSLSAKFLLQGDFRAMRACALEVLARDEGNIDGLVVQAEADLYMDREERAAEAIRKVLAKEPEHLRALLVQAEIYAGNFRLDQEIPALCHLLQIGWKQGREHWLPYTRLTMQRAMALLVDAYSLAAEPEKAAEVLFEMSRLAEKPAEQADAYSKALFLTNYRSQPVSASLKLHEGYAAFFSGIAAYQHAAAGGRRKKLRIGYISPDFRLHAAAYFFTPFLRDFSQAAFEVFVYSAGRHDRIMHRFKSFPVHWRDIQGLSADEAAGQIHEDRIDVLVDLSGHTQDSCLPVLARRPAPVQISGIGYMNTTGLPMVDYFFSDAVCLPVDESVRGFTESIVRLPHSHFCFAPSVVRDFPASGLRAPFERNRYITFGSFNNFSKVTAQTLQLWRGIMEQVPESRLVIKSKICSIESGREIVRQRLQALHMNLARVEMRPYSPDYLEQYRDIDIALDTSPYTGGATTCEALYMGVPVVTLRGRTHGARFGASILESAGVPELVADSDMDYVKRAVQIASSPEVLGTFHARLRETMEQSPLMDGLAYMKGVEQAYYKIWAKYREMPSVHTAPV